MGVLFGEKDKILKLFMYIFVVIELIENSISEVVVNVGYMIFVI